MGWKCIREWTGNTDVRTYSNGIIGDLIIDVITDSDRQIKVCHQNRYLPEPMESVEEAKKWFKELYKNKRKG